MVEIGMSEKSIAQKLGLKPGAKLLVRQQPDGFEALIGALPASAELVVDGIKSFPLVLVFAENRAALVEGLPIAKRQLEAGGALWVAYIKGASDKKTDINRDSIREYVATVGMDTVAQIAIDDDWSALRLKIV
jgi:hypothetical protein